MKELQRKILQLSSEEGDINTNWVVSDSYLEDTLADVDRRNFELNKRDWQERVPHGERKRGKEIGN